jgi:hypothetical protein
VTLAGTRITETAPERNSIDDRYTVQYTLTRTGDYALSIILDTWGSSQHGMHIEGSPFSLTIVSSAAKPEKTEAVGDGLVSTTAGEVASFVIQTRDQYGNIETDLPVVGIGDRVVASAQHKLVETEQIAVAIQRIANATVRYDATYVATFSGTYDVTVTLNGHVVGSGVPIEVEVIPADTHAPSCVFEGAGVAGSTAGTPGVVQLYAKDRFGNLVPDEANDFFLRMFCYSGRCGTSYDASTPVDITDTDPERCAQADDPCTDRFKTHADMGLDDSNAGFYQGEYYVEVAGQYLLKVDLGGLFVGTPTSVLVTINPTGFDHEKSIAEGDGLIEGKAGTPAVFVITAKDMYDNQLTEGGLVFSVQVRGPSFVLGAVTDEDDGTYRVTYEPRVRGNYRIQVRSRGQQIPCRTVEPYQCHTEETTIPGTLEVTQALSGDWLFMCTPAATFADRSFAYGQGLTYGVADASIFQEFTIQALDKFGVTQENGGESDSFRVDIKKGAPEHTSQFDCDIADLDWNPVRMQCYELVQIFTLGAEADQLDGTYFVRYQAQLAGEFMMHVMFNNDTIDNEAVCNVEGFNPYPCDYYDILASPFPLTVEAGPIFESKCTAVGFDELIVMAGENTDFIVQTKDEFGNNGKYDVYGVDRGIWGEMVPCIKADVSQDDDCEPDPDRHDCCPLTDQEITAAGLAKVSLSVRNMLDGTYRATLWARYSTTYLMTVKVGGATNGVEIDGSPYFKEVLPGVSSVAHLHVEMPGEAAAGDVLTFIARTRDAYGNWLVAGGEALSIEMRTTIGDGLSRTSVTTVFDFDSHNDTQSVVVDNGDGRYECEFALTIAGEYTSTVKLGVEVADERPLIVGPAGETDSGSCTADGPGWNGAFWSNPASFSVQARDMYGNPRAVAGDIFKMEFAEVVALNNSGSIVLTTVLTGSGSSIDINPASTGAHVRDLFGVNMGIRIDGQDASESETGVSTRGQYVGGRLVPWDFQQQPEDLILDINGVLQQFEVNINVRNAGDFIALIQPLIADAVEMTAEYGIELKLPSQMSQAAIRSLQNESQPLKGSYYGPGLHRMDYFPRDLASRNVPQQAFAIFVYRCIDSTDACERKANISGSPRLVTVATPVPDPSPTTSVMVGDIGGVAGDDNVITLQTRNSYGINEVSGGANVTFVVEWEVAPPVPEIDESLIEEVDNGVGSHIANDNGDGSYSLRTNRFTVAAYYVLSVLLTYDGGTTLWEDQPIAGSPFRILITPAALDLQQTTAGPPEATGIAGGRIDPLNPAEFSIFPRDSFGNAYVPSVDYSEAERGFEVSLAGPALDDGTQYVVHGVLTELCVLTETGAPTSGFQCAASAGSVSDFVIDVQYSVTLSGEYSLSITFDRGIPTEDVHGRIEDGEPKMVVFEPGVPTAEHSYVSGEAINGGSAGTTHNFTVSALDAFGNVVNWASRRRMQATTIASAHSPIVYTVPVGISTGFEVVRLEETDISQILEKTPTVTRATTITTTTVSIVTPTMVRGQISNATVAAHGDGTFKVGYSLFVAGTYNVSILVGGSHVVGSPYTATITAAELYTPDCVAIGPGLDTARAGKEASFVIYAKDAYGNALTEGGNTFAVTLEGPVFLRADVGDNSDGTYMVQYQPMTSGRYNVAITRSEADSAGQPEAIHVKDSPFAMTVQPGKTFAGSCDATGPGLSEAVAGITRGFTIQAKDQLGATLMTGGDTFVVQLDSAALSIPGTVIDNADGTYSVTYRVTRSGQYQIGVLMGVENIDGSPFELDVVPAQISAEKCVATGDGLAGMTAGDFNGGKFVITAHDHYGNRRRKGGDFFTILVQGLENGYAMTGDVIDNDDGTYSVSYLVTVIGAYDVQVLEGLAGVNDIGRAPGIPFSDTGYLPDTSPFQAQVNPAATDFERTLVDNIPGRMDPRCVGSCPQIDPDCPASGCVYTPDATDDLSRGGSFRITANDRFGNKKDSSDPELSSIPFKAVLSTMYTPRCNSFSDSDCSERLVPHKVEAEISAVAEDGTFIARFASTLAGEYTIAVTYAIGSVEGYPVLVQSNTFVRPADLSVEHSYPFGPGLRGGLIDQNVTLGIQCVDQYGNLIYRRMTSSSDTFRVTISQSSSDTKYDSVANPTRVAVQANDSPNTRDYTNIVGYGSICGEDRRCTFGPGEDSCTVCGTYTVMLNVPFVDTWKLTANRQGVSLATAPPMSMLSGFTIRFVDNLGTISYLDSEAYVANGIVGQMNSFKIQAKTQSSAGRDDALEVPTGGYQVKVEIVPLRMLDEQVAPATLDATPTSEMCLGDVTPDQYRWTTDNGRVDGNFNFITDSNTIDNNDGTVTVTWSSSEVGEHRVVVLMVDDGNPMGQGYDFPMVNSECVRNMPRIINVTTAAISAAETVAYGPGLSLGDAGTELTFTIDTRDRFGNVRSYNPDQSAVEEAFSVVLTPFPETPDSASRTIAGITEDLSTGQFLGAYTSTVAGVYHVSVEYGGVPISGSPFTTTVAAGEVHTPSCKASGQGLVSTQAGDISTYNIAANDQFGNLNSPATSEVFIANFNFNPDQTTGSVDPAVVSSIAHGSNGNYIGTYNATVAGQYTLEILRETPQGTAAIDTAGGSAYYSLVVHPGTTAAQKCVASGLGLSGGTAGDLQNFMLTAADRFGNRVLTGGDVFVVEAVMTNRYGMDVPPAEAERKWGTVHDNLDGTYEVEYRAILDGTFRLDVKLNGLSIASAPFNDVILNMAQPPEMLSCIFAENGGSVVVSFDGATNRAGMEARGPCDAVLDPLLTIPLLGSDPECFWSQPDRLVIFLGNSFQLDLGVGKIRLRGYSLRSLAENSEYAIGEMSPDFPANPPVPQIQVRASTSIGVCEDVQLDASGTTGTGGRPVYFQWGVQIGPSNASLIQQKLNEGAFHEYTKLIGNCEYQENPPGKFNIPCEACENQFGEARPMTLDECKVDCATRSACRGFLYRASGGGHCVPKSVTCQNPQPFTSITDYFYYELADAQVQIPYNYLAAEESYTFVLQVANWMGESSSWSGEIHKMSVAIPALTMLTGGSQAFPMEFASSSAVDLSASILVPECIESARFNYRWSILSGPTNPPLDERTQTKLSLHIPKLTLQPGHDYILNLHAELHGSPEQANTATAYIRVLFSDLVAVIIGGDRTVAAAEELEVSAAESYDPDETLVPFSYRWTCSPVDSTAAGCFTHLPLDGAVSQAVMSQILFDTTRQVLRIPAGALQADSSYLFTANVEKEARVTGIASVTINAVAGNPPEIAVSYVQPCPDFPVACPYINPTERLLLQGDVTVRDANGEAVEADHTNSVWRVSPCPGLPSLVSCDASDNPAHVQQQGTTFIVNKDILTPGSAYVFQLKHTAGGIEGYSQIQVEVNSRPFGGLFKVQPLEGTELDMFAMSASDWVDEARDLPFMYAFRAMAHDSELKSLRMLATKPTNSHSSMLPKGNVTVYCSIMDKYGAATHREKSVMVLEAEFDPAQAAADFQNSMDSGDGSAVLGMVAFMTSNTNGAAGRRRAQQRQLEEVEMSPTLTAVLRAVQLVHPLGDQATVETSLSDLDSDQELLLRVRLNSALSDINGGEDAELPTNLLLSLHSAQEIADYIEQSATFSTIVTAVKGVYGSMNPSPQSIAQVATAVASVVDNPNALAGTVQAAAMDIYEDLVQGAIDEGLEDSAGSAFTRIGSKLMAAAEELLPPTSILPNLATYNVSDRSNVMLVNYAERATLVSQLGVRVEGVLNKLSQAQLAGRIAGEEEIVTTEENFIMQVRRLAATDPGLRDMLVSATGTSSDFFDLPEGLLNNQDAATIAGSVSYKMINYALNPLLAQAHAMPADRYMSTISSLALYGVDPATQQPVELPVQQLDTPITVGMTIPTAYQNFNNPAKQANCKWFDASDNTWKSSGCEVIAVSNNTINCSCTHLTNFAAFLEDSFVDIVPESFEDFADIFSLVDPGSMHTMLGIGGVFLLYLFAVGWGYKRDLYVKRLQRVARRKEMRKKGSSSGRSSPRSGTGGGSSYPGDSSEYATSRSESGTGASSMKGPVSTRSGTGSLLSGATGSGMLAARHRKAKWRGVLKSKLVVRHLWYSIGSRTINQFYSRAQQATVLLTATLAAMFLCAFFLHVSVAEECTAATKLTADQTACAAVELGLSTSRMACEAVKSEDGSDISACTYVDPVQRDTTLTSNAYDPLNAVYTGFVSASLACPLVNFLSYLFMLCGRLKRSVLESAGKYGSKRKWRPTSVYALLWLSSVLYSFCVLICVSCAFSVLLIGSKMDGGQGLTWLTASGVAIFTEAVILRPLYCALEAAWGMRRREDSFPEDGGSSTYSRSGGRRASGSGSGGGQRTPRGRDERGGGGGGGSGSRTPRSGR